MAASVGTTISYGPSWRRVPWVAGFCALFAWRCYIHSDTNFEVDHRLALAGAWFFALVGGTFLLRQVCGVPRLILGAEGFTVRGLFEMKEYAWSRFGDFEVGPSHLMLESVYFVDRETGFRESFFNFTGMPSASLCKQMSEWGARFVSAASNR